MIKKPKKWPIMWTAVILLIVLFIGLLVWTLEGTSTFIVGGGSTSVQPILDEFSNEYERVPKGKQNILYNAIGSQAALTGVENGSYSFGFLSETVENPQASQLWRDHKIQRYVIALDYILLVYHLPDGAQLNKNPKLATNDKYGQHLIFGAFNYKDPSDDSGAKRILALYNHTESWSQAFPGVFASGGDSDAFAITREPGSGTRDFFENDVIQNKRYNYDQIATSNGDMVSSIIRTPGSIGYASFPFIDMIFKSGTAHIGAILNDNTTQLPYDVDTLDFNKKYNLNRPFTGILNTKSSNYYKTLKFIAWMINPWTSGLSIAHLTKADAAYWMRTQGERPIEYSTDPKSAWYRYNDYKPKNFPTLAPKSIYQLVRNYYVKHLIPGDSTWLDKEGNKIPYPSPQGGDNA